MRRFARKETGFSLIELMISLMLGLLLSAAVLSIFFTAQKNNRQGQAWLAMQDNARYAQMQLMQDISMSGFFADVGAAAVGQDVLALQNVNSAQHCGPGAANNADWAFNLGLSLEHMNQASPSDVIDQYSCLQNVDILPGSDILVVRRTRGLADASFDGPDASLAGLSVGQLYVRGNQRSAELSYVHAEASELEAALVRQKWPQNYYRYLIHIYFLQPYNESTADGIPSLCRAQLDLSQTNGMNIQCLAEGVEQMDFRFGLDSDADGSVDQYLDEVDAADMPNVVSVRMRLLVRASQTVEGYSNEKSYEINGLTIKASDNYYRRLVDNTVLLANQQMAQQMSAGL